MSIQGTIEPCHTIHLTRYQKTAKHGNKPLTLLRHCYQITRTYKILMRYSPCQFLLLLLCYRPKYRRLISTSMCNHGSMNSQAGIWSPSLKILMPVLSILPFLIQSQQQQMHSACLLPKHKYSAICWFQSLIRSCILAKRPQQLTSLMIS